MTAQQQRGSGREARIPEHSEEGKKRTAWRQKAKDSSGDEETDDSSDDYHDDESSNNDDEWL